MPQLPAGGSGALDRVELGVGGYQLSAPDLADHAASMSGIDASNLRHWAPSGTGVLPVSTMCFGRRTAAARLFGTSWPMTS